MESVRGAGVLAKAIAILHALAAGPLTLGELQAAVDLPRATTHRLAVGLEDHGIVRRDEAGRFCLGLALVALGRSAAEGFPLTELARPAMAELAGRTGESVQLYVREGDARRCVVSLQSRHGLRWIVPEGALLPLGVGSAGRLLAVGGRAGRSGWVASVEEREPGVASVSAPVLGSDRTTVAALSVSGPVERLTRRPGERFGADVVDAAEQVTDAIRRTGAIRPR